MKGRRPKRAKVPLKMICGETNFSANHKTFPTIHSSQLRHEPKQKPSAPHKQQLFLQNKHGKGSKALTTRNLIQSYGRKTTTFTGMMPTTRCYCWKVREKNKNKTFSKIRPFSPLFLSPVGSECERCRNHETFIFIAAQIFVVSLRILNDFGTLPYPAFRLQIILKLSRANCFYDIFRQEPQSLCFTFANHLSDEDVKQREGKPLHEKGIGRILWSHARMFKSNFGRKTLPWHWRCQNLKKKNEHWCFTCG